jgi:hypothetical protein
VAGRFFTLASRPTRRVSRIAANHSAAEFNIITRGNAEGSTLRRTLGVLLEGESGYQLRRVGSGKRITLTHAGEQYLDEWMARNAFVAWLVCPEPWLLERALLKEVSCPLNIADNGHHPFTPILKRMRGEAIRRARELPIANEQNQQRQ